MTDLRKLLDEATKGPWSDGRNMIVKRGEIGPVRWIVQKVWDDEQGKADARLIVMAPDLAAALLKAEESLEQLARDAESPQYSYDRNGPGFTSPHGYEYEETSHFLGKCNELAASARATLTEIRKLTGAA